MIKHLVMWRLRDHAHGSEDSETRLEVQRVTAAMRRGIAGLRALEIGFSAYRGTDAADLALYAEFDSWEALQAYEHHPLHEQLKRLIGPLRAERRVVDYEATETEKV
jgi:hypothetical protein